MDEIEDAVLVRIKPGDEGGPRHRALRRRRGAQPLRSCRCCASRARFGSASQCRSTNPGSMPSTPITINFLAGAASPGSRQRQQQLAIRQPYATATSGSAFHPRRRRQSRKGRSAVGAMSSIPGSPPSNLRLENSTPGTRCGSTQWSPLQALRVVFEHARGHSAHGGVPGGAIARPHTRRSDPARLRGTARDRSPTAAYTGWIATSPSSSSCKPGQLRRSTHASAPAASSGRTMPCASRPRRFRYKPPSPNV